MSSVWFIDLDAGAEQVADCSRYLSVAERTRAERYVRFADRAAFTLCRAALRVQLSEILDCRPLDFEFSMGRGGKPRLPNCNIQFNISHTTGLGALITCRGTAVGIDIECTNRFSLPGPGLVRHILHPSDQLDRPDPLDVESLVNIWVVKEAYLKAVGVGLSIPMNRIEIVGRDISGDRDETGKLPSGILAASWIGEGYHCAAVALADVTQPQLMGILRSRIKPMLNESSYFFGNSSPFILDKEVTAFNIN